MFSPIPAKPVEYPKGSLPGVCSALEQHGAWVRHSGTEVIITLLAVVPTGNRTLAVNVPFLLDTGSEMTVIPRRLLGDTRSRGQSERRCGVTSLGGRTFV